jgi:hypothetical protein
MASSHGFLNIQSLNELTYENFGPCTTSQSYRYTGCAAVTSFGCAAVSCSPTHYERGLQERLGLQLRRPLLGGSVLPN